MTYPPGADLYQAVLPGGQVTLTQMFETYRGSGQPQQVSGVTITITPASGGAAAVGPTSAGIVPASGASLAYTWVPAPGITPSDYLAVWAATGQSGALSYTQVVTVAALPQLTPAPGCYASVAQYQGWSGDMQSPVPIVQTALRRATEVIDRALIGAVYITDANTMPVDPGVIDVFMRATCAQCQFMLANNDLANVKSQYGYTNMSTGTQVTRTASAQGQIFPPLAPQAAAILQTAGALMVSPMLGW